LTAAAPGVAVGCVGDDHRALERDRAAAAGIEAAAQAVVYAPSLSLRVVRFWRTWSQAVPMG
jgi:hypothetical protein